MRVAVVGCGNVSESHFRALEEIPGAEIVAAVDIKKDRAEEKAARYGAAAYTDFGEMLKAVKPDCVHIATPHYLHTPMAVKALENGAHVFLEKPCSVSSKEVDELTEAEKKYGRYLGVCFQNRYNNSSVLAKEITDSGKFGKLTAVRAFLTWDRDEKYYSDDWHGTADKECGGVLINQAIHTVDLVQYLSGGCRRLSAHVHTDRLKGKIAVEDTATVRMELGCGATGIVFATTGFSGNSDVLIELTFEKALLRIEGEKLYRIYPDGGFELLCGKLDREFTGRSYWGHGHSAIIREFYDCINTGRPFPLNSAEGGKAAKIIAACYRSSITNNAVEVK